MDSHDTACGELVAEGSVHPEAPLSERSPFGRTGISIPPIVFGTSCLGNLYAAPPWGTKRAIMAEWFRRVRAPVALDTAGKYGAGLALETLGRGLRELGVRPDEVVISNKLGWLRTPLSGPEPTFEPGAWVGLEHDAVQRISHEGILRCWEQGCELLDGYRPSLVSVHDPDEYLAAAPDEAERRRRLDEVVAAYGALRELKARGEVKGVGVGAKDWTVIRELADSVELDWVMLACSLTVLRHPARLLAFVDELHRRGVGIINSAVFHAGFLTGGGYFDYKPVSPADPRDAALFGWRERFETLCARHGVSPAAACVEFGISPPGVASIALNSSKPRRVGENARLVQARAPESFWLAMKADGLIAADYPHLGTPGEESA